MKWIACSILTAFCVWGILFCLPPNRALAADLQPVMDVPYREKMRNERTTLDVYPGPTANAPVVVWVHGGAWEIGSKTPGAREKADFLFKQGWGMVSINYRMHPEVKWSEMASDVAHAIAWVVNANRPEIKSPASIVLMGHSAGAHLAALVATDPRYLKAADVQLNLLSGVILLDGAGYDIPEQIRIARLPRMKEMYEKIFSADEATQKEASPTLAVQKGIGIPPFLILYVASRADSRQQAMKLQEALKRADVSAAVEGLSGKNHATINRELPIEGDSGGVLVRKFLSELSPSKN
ncbi:Esterase/lipase-like protein [Planctopirus limnophila DSM 3776]|uniref:Esterase/lipase-like protein n=1 Tax=Planctopirus limnophila (strain ATCC 43296 / DSM 3776 / IFAM 1008 / Mu 290) TaxID=521674 RepID=D5SVJ8_PLAL2|nr:alpha/beta hydrolase [Planctopirus limnophila]ADG67268.1 Esterase/lipase-like protein [Planctopirus limnophila DSM 3776]